MKTKYPPIEPNRTSFLEVDSHHSLYFEESGNPNGIAVLFLHGGPGSGTDPGHRTYFNPKKYRIILIDQRGAGKSLPSASLVDNTTWHLVSDLEHLRKELKIDQWLLFGGSWGSTLALTYAITHPARVSGLILRGIFLTRPQEIKWFYQEGASHIFSDEWEKFFEFIPKSERGNLIEAYYKRLTSDDQEIRKKAAAHWSRWEVVNLKLRFDPEIFKKFTADVHADSIARIECHYFMNRSFFKSDNWILENIASISDIPGVIVQGRYDLICPFQTAWELHKALPKLKFVVIDDAGHSASEPGITDALLDATDCFIPNIRKNV